MQRLRIVGPQGERPRKRRLCFKCMSSLLFDRAEQIGRFCPALRTRERLEYFKRTVILSRFETRDRQIVVDAPGLGRSSAYPLQDWNCCGRIAMFR